MNTTNISSQNSSAAPVNKDIILLNYLLTFHKNFNLYVTIAFLLPGLALNGLTSYVFTRKRFWDKSTMGYYYSVSTALSSLALIFGILFYWSAFFNNELVLKSVFLCKVNIFTMIIFKKMSKSRN